MSSLPLELIHDVVDNVSSTTDLRTLREVNKTFKTLATPGAFRVLHVRVHAESVQGLKNIHDSDDLRHFVEEVIFNYGDKPSDDEELDSIVLEDDDGDECWDSDESENNWEDGSEDGSGAEDGSEGEEHSDGMRDETSRDVPDSESEGDILEGNDSPEDDGGENDDTSESEMTDAGDPGLFGWPDDYRDIENMRVLWPALFRLNQFTSLKALRFSFREGYRECRRLGGTQPSPHFLVQKAVIASIASDPYPSTVKSLSLTNVVGVEDNAFESSAFQTVVSSLQSLSISTIAPEYESGCDFQLRHWYNAFWQSTIPKRFLVPAESSLTSLSLGSDVLIGPIDEFNINHYFFPRLSSLKLSHFLFCWCPVDEFILKHKATLQKLELRNCEMYVSHLSARSSAPPRHWSDVYNNFQAQLTKLEELMVVTSTWRNEFHGLLYSEMGDESDFYQVELEEESEKDAMALEELRTAVASRTL